MPSQSLENSLWFPYILPTNKNNPGADGTAIARLLLFSA
jgi:hypothetical protein